MSPEPVAERMSAPLPGSVFAAPRRVNDLDLDAVSTGAVVTPERWAGVAGAWADIVSRVAMVVVICVIFLWLNHRVMDFVQQAFEADLKLLSAAPPAIQPDQRLVTANVVVSLIGATVVQVGIAVVSIVSYLFPKSERARD